MVGEKGFACSAAVDQHLSRVTDPEVLRDVVARAFIPDPFRWQEVLREAWGEIGCAW